MTPIEEVLTATLRDHASDVVPTPWSVDAAIGGGGRLRRRRALVVTSSLVVAVLAVVVATFGIRLPVPGGRDQIAAGAQRIVLPGGGYPGVNMDADNVYVWYMSNGPEGPFVAVVDRSTNRVVRRGPLPGDPERFVSGPGNSLWFSMRISYSDVGQVLVQLDRRTLAVRRTLRLIEPSLKSLTPILSLAVVGNQLWVGGELSLYQLDGTNGRMLRRMDLDGHVVTVATDAGSGMVYANVVGGRGPDGLVQLDSRTGKVTARRDISGLAAPPVPAGNGVWLTLIQHSNGPSILRHLDRRGLVDRDTGQAGRRGGSAFAQGGTERLLFLADNAGHGAVTCADPDSGRVLGSRALVTPVLADAEAIYGLGPGVLERVDTSAACGR